MPQKGRKWSKDELLQVFNIYPECKKAIHENNKSIIALAKHLGRGTRTVEAQLIMFRALERADQGEGYSRNRMSSLCVEIWEENRSQEIVSEEEFTSNPYTQELLNWRGDEKGGVHKPFNNEAGNPLGQVLETTLTQKLKEYSAQISRGDKFPRWVFLVGGPGNGKSMAIEYFGKLLDKETGCEGRLLKLLENKFNEPDASSIISISHTEVTNCPDEFSEKIGSLHIIQDASTADKPTESAAVKLTRWLMENRENDHCVILCCINKGMLARCIEEAPSGWGESVAGKVFCKIYNAIQIDGKNNNRLKCWDLSCGELNFSCWPLDIESLMLSKDFGGMTESAFTSILKKACDKNNWIVCEQCSVRKYCPFTQNAQWLRENQIQDNFVKLLRHYELKVGERWNFREIFSLTVECLIGQRNDFDGYTSPCQWVHHHAGLLDPDDGERLKHAWTLTRRLTPHAIFCRSPFSIDDNDLELKGKNSSNAVISLRQTETKAPKSGIRTKLRSRVCLHLDPAFSSGCDNENISKYEEQFSQSVIAGREIWKKEEGSLKMSPLENIILDILCEAEQEWDGDELDPKYRRISKLIGGLKRIGIIVTKRSIGFRDGFHPQACELQKFRSIIRDKSQLRRMRGQFQELVASDGHLTFEVLSGFAQPEKKQSESVALKVIDPCLPKEILDAPKADEDGPAHDTPYINIKEKLIPLTFDFFLALEKVGAGCREGSLPQSVKTSLDFVRRANAVNSLSNVEEFEQGNHKISISEKWLLEFYESVPEIRENEALWKKIHL
ncbi:hypothetical protein N8677_00750 [Verrucomicrobia bacterium]|nr:hypothetical protein [Verrucomicrobiota bacterium]